MNSVNLFGIYLCAMVVLQSIDRHPPKPVGRAYNVWLIPCDWLKGITWSVVSQLCSSFPAVNFMVGSWVVLPQVHTAYRQTVFGRSLLSFFNTVQKVNIKDIMNKITFTKPSTPFLRILADLPQLFHSAYAAHEYLNNELCNQTRTHINYLRP